MDVQPRRLRHESFTVTSAQAAYIGNALRPAREYPWSLAVGDISDNLDVLLAAFAFQSLHLVVYG